MDLKKIDNQKGVTGIDIVIAITIISITSVAILVLYANIIVNSKKVTRTSAATRIATTIMENIDSMYYAEVEQELHRLSKLNGVEKGEYFETSKYDMILSSKLGEKIFNTKLNSGYNIELIVNEISSPSNTIDYIDITDCPLVLEIKVKVKFEVSNRPQEISLKTIKKRELLQECNAPNINDLLGREFEITVKDKNNADKKVTKKIESLNQVQPIKWSDNFSSYVKTNATDEWYSYLNKEWARVVITGVELKENSDEVKTVFATNSDSVLDIENQTIFVWIPRYGLIDNIENKIAFSNGSSNHRILAIEMDVGRHDYNDLGVPMISKRKFFYNGIATYDYDNSELKGKEILLNIYRNKSGVESKLFEDGASGVWVNITKGVMNNDNKVSKNMIQNIEETLNNSSYGPPITRLGDKSKIYY